MLGHFLNCNKMKTKGLLREPVFYSQRNIDNILVFILFKLKKLPTFPEYRL